MSEVILISDTAGKHFRVNDNPPACFRLFDERKCCRMDRVF